MGERRLLSSHKTLSKNTYLETALKSTYTTSLRKTSTACLRCGHSTKKKRNVIVVIAGGDGSIAKFVEDLANETVDLSKIRFCLLPFGTGNDLAQFTGWTNDTSQYVDGENIDLFKTLYKKLLNSKEVRVNIWEVTAKFKTAQKVANKNGQKSIVNIEGGEIKRKMVNYFSFGIESRIGFGFDQKRTSSKLCNLCIYCCEGVKKMFCMRTQKVTELVEYIAKECDGVEIPLYQTTDTIKSVPLIVGHPASIVFSNITSFAGGRTHPWRDSKHPGINTLFPPLLPQNTGDNILEICTFPTNMKFTLELACKGHALRIGQEQGPLLIKFNKNSNAITFINIDGEYCKLFNPEDVKIELWNSPYLPASSIIMLSNIE